MIMHLSPTSKLGYGPNRVNGKPALHLLILNTSIYGTFNTGNPFALSRS